VLSAVPRDLHSLRRIGEIYYNAKHYDKATEYFLRALASYPQEPTLHSLLADCYMGLKQYHQAAQYCYSLLDLAKASGDIALIREIKVRLGDALYLSGAQSAGIQLYQQVIGEEPEHFNALFSYGKALIEHAELSDSMPVFLKLLVHQSENKKVRNVLADLVRTPEGRAELRRELAAIPKPASAMAFLAMVVKEFGAIEAAIELYAEALAGEPSSSSHALNLVHVVELVPDYERVFSIIKKFCYENPNLSVGPCSCAKIYNLIRGHSSINTEMEEDVPALPLPVTRELPLDQMYPPDQLDLMAFFCTLTKALYIEGNIELVPLVTGAINPAREGRPMHTTTVRNEVAYHCCISQLLEYHKLPRDRSPPAIYLAGDSHALVSAYQTIKFQGVPHTITPLLVTGLKCWHLRPDSDFFPKFNFWNVIPRAPRGSHVIMQFGEIDCREGFVLAVQKCIYQSIEEGCLVAINIYINVLLEVIAKYDYVIYVHPAVPVINITRDIVKTFNTVLKRRVLETPALKWLEMIDCFLTEDGKDLKPEFELDGTHLNPLYLPYLEEALAKVTQ